MQLRSAARWASIFSLILLPGCGVVKTQSGPVADTDFQNQQEQRLHIGHLNGGDDSLFKIEAIT